MGWNSGRRDLLSKRRGEQTYRLGTLYLLTGNTIPTNTYTPYVTNRQDCRQTEGHSEPKGQGETFLYLYTNYLLAVPIYLPKGIQTHTERDIDLPPTDGHLHTYRWTYLLDRLRTLFLPNDEHTHYTQNSIPTIHRTLYLPNDIYRTMGILTIPIPLSLS